MDFTDPEDPEELEEEEVYEETWVDGVQFGAVMLFIGLAGAAVFHLFLTRTDSYFFILPVLFMAGTGFFGAILQFFYATYNRSAGWASSCQ